MQQPYRVLRKLEAGSLPKLAKFMVLMGPSRTLPRGAMHDGKFVCMEGRQGSKIL